MRAQSVISTVLSLPVHEQAITIASRYCKETETSKTAEVCHLGSADCLLGSADCLLGSSESHLGSADCLLGSSESHLSSADWATTSAENYTTTKKSATTIKNRSKVGTGSATVSPFQISRQQFFLLTA